MGIYCNRNIAESDDGAGSSMPRRLELIVLLVFNEQCLKDNSSEWWVIVEGIIPSGA